MAKKTILSIAQDQIAQAARVGMKAVVNSAAEALTKTGAAAGDAVSRTTKQFADVKLRSKRPPPTRKPKAKKAKKKRAARRSSKKRL